MPARPSPSKRRQCQSRTRRPWTLREDVPPRRLERVERRQAAAGEEANSAPHAAADDLLQDLTPREEPAGASCFEPQQLGELWARPVEHGNTEPAGILRRAGDAPRVETARGLPARRE